MALRRDWHEDDRPVAPGAEAVRPVSDADRPAFDCPPMESVRPPAAENDNPLSAFRAVVEADLRVAGYLR